MPTPEVPRRVRTDAARPLLTSPAAAAALASLAPLDRPATICLTLDDDRRPLGSYVVDHGSLGDVAGPLKELAAVCDFLNRRGLAWRVRSEEGAQHYEEEMRQFLTEARRTFADCPPMLKGLDRYQETVGDLLEDD